MSKVWLNYPKKLKLKRIVYTKVKLVYKKTINHTKLVIYGDELLHKKRKMPKLWSSA